MVQESARRDPLRYKITGGATPCEDEESQDALSMVSKRQKFVPLGTLFLLCLGKYEESRRNAVLRTCLVVHKTSRCTVGPPDRVLALLSR